MRARCAGPLGILLCLLSDCAVARSTPPQPIRLAPFSAACPDGHPLAPDTMTVTVYIAPAPHGSSIAPKAPRAATVAAVHAIAEAFSPPRVLVLPHPISWVETATGGPPRTFPLLAAALDLTRIRPDTQVTGRFRSATGSEALNAALRAAVAAADSVGGLAKPLPGAAGDTLHLVMGGSVSPPAASTMLFVVLVRYYPLDQAVSIVEQPQPHHPAPGFDDAIDLRFVVDARGQAVPATIEVVGGNYREMAEEAVRVVTASRFMPARRRDCSVPQLVYQRIGFHTKR